MNLSIIKTAFPEIVPLREGYLQEMACQIRYEAAHHRGWSDEYRIQLANENIGYGSVKGLNKLQDRDTVFEFFLLPSHRKFVSEAFKELLTVSGAVAIECQTNDGLLMSLLFEFANNISADTILFSEGVPTILPGNGARFRSRTDGDNIFPHTTEPEGDFVLDLNGVIVATGGFTTYYNKPFADIYMEVAAAHRGRGYGSFLVQELKRECKRQGYTPAARCHISNTLSKATLLKAGMHTAGYLLQGDLRQYTP